MVADLSSTPTPPPKPPSAAKPNRAPLVSNNNNASTPPQRRQKLKHLPTTTNRFPSPATSPSPVTNRSNHHPRTVELSSSAKILTKTSARSLSVSFQGESFALPVSKVEKPANNGLNNFTREKKKAPETVRPVLRKSITDETKLDHIKPETIRDYDESDRTDSDPESVSSSSSLGHVRGPRAIVVPARFWQETINLLRRVQPVGVSATPQLLKTKRMSFGRKVGQEGAKVVPRGEGSVFCVPKDDGLGNTVSVLSFCGDVKRGKVGEKKVVDVHVLRVLHNKHLQWRFANARADAAMLVQRAAAKLQQLKHNLKLHSLLKKQILHLDDWDLTDKDYSISLAGAIEALESSSLCLPVLSGAKADMQDLKDAVCTAADTMQAMAVSICSLVTKVENVNLMTSELASAMKFECSLLDQCKDLLSTLTLMEQQDCSLRAHTLQLIPAATNDTTTKDDALFF
ncbi:hypothetical protein M8C21_025505 [Ambrosia artemisiifolia]|uniref:Uncharacterized protein n=1 Tax=Ambrosia artemisiifolia TaxID=4212 RepID=A0AAD5GVE1_AMBAR|nr:hypothetical protein M8C21_025505 [Ambrosia artemisiifolia]